MTEQSIQIIITIKLGDESRKAKRYNCGLSRVRIINSWARVSRKKMPFKKNMPCPRAKCGHKFVFNS